MVWGPRATTTTVFLFLLLTPRFIFFDRRRSRWSQYALPLFILLASRGSLHFVMGRAGYNRSSLTINGGRVGIFVGDLAFGRTSFPAWSPGLPPLAQRHGQPRQKYSAPAIAPLK